MRNPIARVSLVAAAIFLSGALTAAHAADTKTAPKAVAAPPAAKKMMPNRPSRFDEVDTNHDGFISRDEFLAAESKQFQNFDTNHDGKVDAKEIASSPPLMERNERAAERMIKQWDANGDGTVTRDEFRAFATKRFERQDKDGSGKIPRRMPMPASAPMKKGQTPVAPEKKPQKKD